VAPTGSIITTAGGAAAEKFKNSLINGRRNLAAAVCFKSILRPCDMSAGPRRIANVGSLSAVNPSIDSYIEKKRAMEERARQIKEERANMKPGLDCHPNTYLHLQVHQLLKC
jgi:hypothetical protein